MIAPTCLCGNALANGVPGVIPTCQGIFPISENFIRQQAFLGRFHYSIVCRSCFRKWLDGQHCDDQVAALLGSPSCTGGSDI